MLGLGIVIIGASIGTSLAVTTYFGIGRAYCAKIRSGVQAVASWKNRQNR